MYQNAIKHKKEIEVCAYSLYIVQLVIVMRQVLPPPRTDYQIHNITSFY